MKQAMSIENLLSEIESISFATRLTILSGFRLVLDTLENDETIQRLISSLRDSPENQQAVYERILELLPANKYPGYMHSDDPALTGYLYALNEVNSELAQQAIRTMLQTPNLFWARWLAIHIADEVASDPGFKSVDINFSEKIAVFPISTDSGTGGESIANPRRRSG